MGNDCSCHGCTPPNRYPGCHGNCKEYQDWKTSEQEKKDAERKRREQEAVMYASARWKRK